VQTLVPHNALVLVADARKAVLLRNVGSAAQLELRVSETFEAPPNPPSHLQGTDRPGRIRSFDRRSAMEDTDWHELAEKRFALSIAEAVEVAVNREAIPAVVVVAAPRTLSELRRAFPESIRRRITAELDRDLTGHPVAEIEKLLS
jgi:protein required for attachment to host cells